MKIKKDELKDHIVKAYSLLKECRLCPRNCGVNRLKEQKGICMVGKKPIVSSYGLHFGEERVLVDFKGSGTVFFGGCPLRCVYCQNYSISQLLTGKEVSNPQLAKIFLSIQRQGALNLNLVTPTHVVPMILEALYLIYDDFHLPVVYNTGGYDALDTLLLLDGIVDIYMPDVKYGDNKKAFKYSLCPDYFDVAKIAIKEMHRQVGDLVVENGIARKGLLIRHLVLPNGLADSIKVLNFIKDEVSTSAHVNIMDQYHPAYKAKEYPELSRNVTLSEFEEVVMYAQEIGLPRVN